MVTCQEVEGFLREHFPSSLVDKLNDLSVSATLSCTEEGDGWSTYNKLNHLLKREFRLTISKYRSMRSDEEIKNNSFHLAPKLSSIPKKPRYGRSVEIMRSGNRLSQGRRKDNQGGTIG